MSSSEERTRLAGEDGQLVDLAAAVLADPNLHTDTRMRLQRQITTLLESSHRELHGTAEDRHETSPAIDDRQVPNLLTAVLVDPNLHTDLRLRLHREITEMLRAARQEPSPS